MNSTTLSWPSTASASACCPLNRAKLMLPRVKSTSSWTISKESVESSAPCLSAAAAAGTCYSIIPSFIMMKGRRRRSFISCQAASATSSSSSSSTTVAEGGGDSKIGARVRVKVPLKVYHVPRVPEVDLSGKEGHLKQHVAVWKGKRISANLPYKVEFVVDIEGRGPVKFFAHLKEDEFDFLD